VHAEYILRPARGIRYGIDILIGSIGGEDTARFAGGIEFGKNFFL